MFPSFGGLKDLFTGSWLSQGSPEALQGDDTDVLKRVEHEPNIDPNFRAGVEDNSRHPANETAEGLSTSQPLRGYQASGELGQLEPDSSPASGRDMAYNGRHKFGGGNGHVDNARTNASGRRHIHSRPGILQVQKSTGANVRNGPEFPEHDMISHRLSKRQKHSHYHVVDHSHPGAFSDPGDDGENDFKIVSQREVSVKKPHSQLRNSQRQSQPSFSSSQEKIPPDFFQQTEFNNVESTMYPRPRRSSYKPSNGHHIQGFEARNSSQSFSQGQQQPLAHQAEKLLSVSSSTGPRVPISYDKLDYCGAGQAQESSPSYRSNLRRRYDQRKQRETEPHPVDDDGDDLEVVELPKTSNSPGRRPNARPAGNASMTPSVPIGTAKQEPKSAKQIKQADHDEHYGHGLTEGDIDSANDVDPLQNDDSDFQIKGVAERHRSNEDELLSNNDISATKFTNSQARQNSPQLSNSRSRKRDRGIERSGWQLTYFANLSFEARGDLMLRPSGNKKYEIVIRGHTQEKVKGEPILDTNKLTLFWFNGEAAKLRIRGPRVDSCDYAVDLAFQQTAELRDFAQHLEDSYFIKGHPKDKHVALSRILPNRNFMENLFKNDPPAQRKTKAPPERLTADADDEFTLIERRTKRYNDLAQRHQEATTSKKPTLISRLQTTTRSTSPTGDQPLGRAQKKLAENSNRNRLQSDAETKINSNNDVFAFDDGGLVHGSFVETPRRSTRATKTTSQYFSVDEAKSNNAIVPVEERYSVKHGLGPAWENPIVFPQTGKDRATVYFDDLPRLDDGEFLNDNLIEFYLRWSRQNAMDAGKLKDGQVHFFNTFFYERLTSGTRGISHAAVQRWTAKVDIFNHDYIVVPVNESAHWYLAIICNLRYLHRKLDLDEPEVVETSNPKIPHIDLGNAPAEDLTAQLMTAATSDGVPDEAPSSSKGIEDQPIAFKRPTGLEIHAVEKDGQLPEARNLQRTDGASPRQESQADEEWPASSETQPQAPISPFKCKTETQESNISAEQADLVGSQGLFKNAQPQSPAAKKGNRRKSGPPPRKYDPNSPMIIILDSLGLAHSKTVRHLKEYVVEEGKSKRSMSSSIDDIKGMNAKGIPQQQNFCDCGLFLLGYIEKFLQDPTNFVTKILSQEFNEFADWPEMNPQKMRDSMRDLLMETYKQQEENRPRKKKKSPKKKATPTKEREVPPTTEERSMFLQKGIQAQMREQDAENRTESKPGDIEDVEPVAARERGSFFGRNGRNPKRSPQAEQQAQLPIALQEAPSILSQPVQDRTLEPVKAANSSNRGTPDVIMANSQPEDEVMLLPTGDVNEMLHEREAKEPEITRLAPRSLPAPKSLRKRTREESIEIPESQEADASMAKSPKRAKESTSSPASRSDGLPFDFPTQFPSLNRLAGSSPSRESRGQQGKTNP